MNFFLWLCILVVSKYIPLAITQLIFIKPGTYNDPNDTLIPTPNLGIKIYDIEKDRSQPQIPPEPKPFPKLKPEVEVPISDDEVPNTFECPLPSQCTHYTNCPDVVHSLRSDNDDEVRRVQKLFCKATTDDYRGVTPWVCCKNIYARTYRVWDPDALSYRKRIKDFVWHYHRFPIARCGHSSVNHLSAKARYFLEKTSTGNYRQQDYKGPEELRQRRMAKTHRRMHRNNATKRAKRLAAGISSRLGEWPWLVSLYHRKGIIDGRKFAIRCIGTIINKIAILSTGFCVSFLKGKLKEVTVGHFDSSIATENEQDIQVIDGIVYRTAQPQVRRVRAMYLPQKFKQHPKLSTQFKSNLGMIILEKDLHLNNFVYPICLPIRTPDNLVVQERVIPKRENDVVTVAAFGDAGPDSPYKFYHRPRHIQLTLLNESECAKKYLGSTPIYDFVNKENIFCAGGGRDNSLCYIDEGAPAMNPGDDGRMFLVGIATNLDLDGTYEKCETHDYPTMFTRIEKYTFDFMVDVLKRYPAARPALFINMKRK